MDESKRAGESSTVLLAPVGDPSRQWLIQTEWLIRTEGNCVIRRPANYPRSECSILARLGHACFLPTCDSHFHGVLTAIIDQGNHGPGLFDPVHDHGHAKAAG